ncbi:MAG: hypothetical protein AAGG56_15485 [Pseudomonadota bacterium]
MKADKTPFFVGYLTVPARLRWFLWTATGALVALAALLGYWIGTTQDDPGPGSFRFDYGQQSVTGIIELTPLPILHVTEGSERIAAGRTIMLSGQGKNGVMNRPAAIEGEVVQASGILLERGALDMLQLGGGENGLSSADDRAAVPGIESLGRWRLAGEICDGKCLAGAMRPGRGLAHKACANLCVEGGVPPVFVSSQPMAGSEYLLISGPERTEIPDVVYDYMGQYISIAGEVTRHGDLLVFALEPGTVEVLP